MVRIRRRVVSGSSVDLLDSGLERELEGVQTHRGTTVVGAWTWRLLHCR